jgi:hypothetical protein
MRAEFESGTKTSSSKLKVEQIAAISSRPNENWCATKYYYEKRMT